MNWLRRLLADTEDDGRFRSGLGILLGATVVVVSLVSGLLDLRSFLIASLGGVLAILPLWRLVAGPSDRPALIVAIVVALLLGIVIRRELPYVAVFTFVGAWGCTLSVIRFVTGWRNPQQLGMDPHLEPVRADRWLAWVVLGVPLLVILGLVIWAIATERGALR